MNITDRTDGTDGAWIMLADRAGLVACIAPEADELARIMQGMPGPGPGFPGPEIPAESPVESPLQQPDERPAESPEEHPDSPPPEHPDDVPDEIPKQQR